MIKIKANFGKTCPISVHIRGLDLSDPGGISIPTEDQEPHAIKT